MKKKNGAAITLENLEGLIGEAGGELAQKFGPAERRAVAKMVDEMDAADDTIIPFCVDKPKTDVI